MPNGGTDCCGFCWFNARNKGQRDARLASESIPAHCIIRDLPVANPFSTYCGNHPKRRPELVPVPLGPVFTGNDWGERELWVQSPDTEEIRLHLLDILEGMAEPPGLEYPLGASSRELVVWQLGEFREERARARLEQIVGFEPGLAELHPFGATNQNLIHAAREALEKIDGHPGAVPQQDPE